MGILAKISLLLLTSVIALVATSTISNVIKSQEMEYYTLAEEIKTLEIRVNEALALQRIFEKTFSDQGLVYEALNKADIYLNKVQMDLLKENAPSIKKVSELLLLFKKLFSKMVGNVEELLSMNSRINKLAVAYSAKNDDVGSRINKQISSGLLTFTKVDTNILQGLKNDSLAAFTSINRIVLFINQDLILEGNIKRFQDNYERSIRDLEIQQKNISIYVSHLKEKTYQDLSHQLAQTYTEIISLVPEFEKLNIENRKISEDLNNLTTEITSITRQITRQSELLREQKNYNITMLQLLGQGSIVLFLLISGYFFAISITRPLRRFIKGANAISDGDYSQGLDITRNDEIGQLAHSFNKMRENLKDSFEIIDKQKAQYKSIFETAIEGIFQASQDGKILKVNRALAEILGYSSPEEMETTISNIALQLYVNPNDRQIYVERLEKDGFVREFEASLKRKDGKIITVSMNTQRLYDETRKLHFYQGMMEDISERKRIGEYKIAKEAAEKSNRVKSEFLANMSHELRTPLNAVIGFSQIMSHDQTLSSDQKGNLQIINRSGKHLLALINDILDMSKIEAGRIALDERDFDLYQLLDEVHDIFKIKADKKGIEIVFEHEPEVPRFVRTDETKLRQILVNLTGNAVKFTQDGSVKVQVNIIGESELQFSISDTGPGIPPDDIDRLFDPFAQTQTGKDSHEGTGLGLSISEKFVNLMGGKISIDSRLERGSIFKFDIKAHKGEKSRIAEELPTRRVIGLEESDSGGNNKHYRILIVDDIHSNRKILATLLAPLGLDIREAKSGREALDVWKEWQPHLIWLDIRMPEIDGYAVIKRIKNTAPEHPTVIISISASTFEEDRQKALDLGCDGFVGKPFKEFEIFEEMKKHLHLRYVYAEDIQKDDLAREAQEQALSLETVKGLPSKWKIEMKQAIEHVDLDQMGILIEEMRKRDETLAEAIQQRIDQFDYEKVLEALG